MSETTADTIIKLAILVFNFALIALATSLVVFQGWSLWTYLGFACFMVSTKDVNDK
jgi:hypothetical protein